MTSSSGSIPYNIFAALCAENSTLCQNSSSSSWENGETCGKSWRGWKSEKSPADISPPHHPEKTAKKREKFYREREGEVGGVGGRIMYLGIGLHRKISTQQSQFIQLLEFLQGKSAHSPHFSSARKHFGTSQRFPMCCARKVLKGHGWRRIEESYIDTKAFANSTVLEIILLGF